MADIPRYKFIYDNYTSLWNVLDYCATTVPVTHVSYTDAKPEYEGRSELETNIWRDCKCLTCEEFYYTLTSADSPEKFAGAPAGVQLVGRRLNEEYLLGVTRACDNALKAAKNISNGCGM